MTRITTRGEKAEAYAKRRAQYVRESIECIDDVWSRSCGTENAKDALRAAFLAGWNARQRAEKKRRGK